MGKKITVNLFDIEWSPKRTQPFEDTLFEFHDLRLGQRWRNDVRIERVERDKVLADDVVKIDFARKREVGPGKMADGAAITGIEMDDLENFGEETAALYVPRRKWLLVLHNQAGVGPTRMMSYCNALDPGVADRHFDYVASPKLDPEVLQKLEDMHHLNKLSVSAGIDALDASQSAIGTSLAEASRPAHARRIKFELTANDSHKRGLHLDKRKIMSLINGLLRRNEGVSKLQVSGESPEVDGKDQLIDLIQHKIRRKYDESELRIVDHRYTLTSRWALLDKALRGWQCL